MKRLTLCAAAIICILTVSSCRMHHGMDRDNNRFGNQDRQSNNDRNDYDDRQGTSGWGGQQGDRPSGGQFNH